MNTTIFFDDSSYPSAKFLVFHYFLKWFITHFGFVLYLLTIVGFSSLFCSYALLISIKNKEWDRTAMIIIFTIIAIGGLIGLGYDINNGHSLV